MSIRSAYVRKQYLKAFRACLRSGMTLYIQTKQKQRKRSAAFISFIAACRAIRTTRQADAFFLQAP